ncbi:MAG TPA: hypothetical protein VHD34_01910 [Xanthobacteraceae bacterium]|nr:hypothetical protein [Xanthobacteraceae bacterium]
MKTLTHATLAFSAALGLLALTQAAGECAFNPKFTHATQLPAGAEMPKADKSSVLLRIDIPGDEEARETPLSCLQMQAIDETDLIAEPTPAADCD